MDGWVGGWMDGWMGWVNGWVGGWVDEWVEIHMCVLTAIGLTPGGNSAVHIYTQTIHRITELIWEECGQCPVCELYPGICLIIEEKARKNLSQGRKNLSQGSEKPQSG